MNKELEENNSNNTIKPQRKFLSFTKTKAFERHPSANGLLVKDDSEIKNKIEDTNFFCNVVQEENENETEKNNLEKIKDERKKSCFQFQIQKIEEKLFQDEIFYTKNENLEKEKKEGKKEKNIYNNHKLYEFSEADKMLDKEITQAIQKGEKEDNIINKINVVKKD